MDMNKRSMDTNKPSAIRAFAVILMLIACTHQASATWADQAGSSTSATRQTLTAQNNTLRARADSPASDPQANGAKATSPAQLRGTAVLAPDTLVPSDTEAKAGINNDKAQATKHSDGVFKGLARAFKHTSNFIGFQIGPNNKLDKSLSTDVRLEESRTNQDTRTNKETQSTQQTQAN